MGMPVNGGHFWETLGPAKAVGGGLENHEEHRDHPCSKEKRTEAGVGRELKFDLALGVLAYGPTCYFQRRHLEAGLHFFSVLFPTFGLNQVET